MNNTLLSRLAALGTTFALAGCASSPMLGSSRPRDDFQLVAACNNFGTKQSGMVTYSKKLNQYEVSLTYRDNRIETMRTPPTRADYESNLEKLKAHCS